MDRFNTIIYEKDRVVAHVILNRPHVINAYNMEMRDELYQVLGAVRDDPDIRVIILKGAGSKGFCSGADLKEFGSAPSQTIARNVRWERDIWTRFLEIKKPIITALHGYVLGSGLEMAMLCDIRISAESAIFGMPEVALSMIPAAGGTQTLPRICGVPHALDLLLTNRRLNASEAKKWGLIHKVVGDQFLANEVKYLSEEIGSFNPKGLQSAKEALNRGLEMPLQDGLEMELRLSKNLIL